MFLNSLNIKIKKEEGVKMGLKALYSLILSIFIMFFSGCAPPKVSLMDYVVTDIDNKRAMHFMPDYVIQKKKPKIAVLPPSDNTPYSRCKLYATAQEYFIQNLAMAGSFELVERAQLNALMDELKFRAGVFGNIDAQRVAKLAEGVNFVFVGSISKANIKTKFTPASSWTDKKGKTHYISASCSEEAEVGLVFRVIEFPEGRIQKAFNMIGKQTNYRNVSSQYDCWIEDICGLLNKAVEKAINSSKKEIFNEFPVYGYIYKTLTNRKKLNERIAFITLGKTDGIKAGSVVEIIEFIRDKDPVKNAEIILQRVVGECTVSETELQNERSICIISEDCTERVFAGHAVKVKF